MDQRTLRIKEILLETLALTTELAETIAIFDHNNSTYSALFDWRIKLGDIAARLQGLRKELEGIV
jgi:hypothetical protein